VELGRKEWFIVTRKIREIFDERMQKSIFGVYLVVLQVKQK
jgi:hypothetical protein